MKREFLLSTTLSMIMVAAATAASNIDSANSFAWTENTGWTNWRDANSTNDGVIVGTDFLEGIIWAENIGWINTGNGAGPYANTNDTNFGVNIVGDDDLTGFAWGENVGWIYFGWGAVSNDPFRARFDFGSGRFRGYAWGENIGWINLDDASYMVAATVGIACDSDTDCHDFKSCTCDTCNVMTGVCTSSPIEYGNTNCMGPANQANLDDILYLLADFSDGAIPTHPSNDLAPPCSGNMAINLDDILQILAAFGGSDPCSCAP